ncbi:MAG: flavodoxin reductase [Flavobacteriaceae bacterium]|nr:MAG: flavodoxin reductase [Flavobacteriaceae bacterium]
MSQFHKLTIKEIIKETANAVSITFDVPEKLKEEFQFIAGQYITIKKEINGKEVRRAYSICSDPNTGILKVAVKAVEGGTFSIYATKSLHVGDKLEVSKPEGRFILEPKSGKNYLAIAAGSGITPIMSMLKASLHDDSTFTLIYGNKSAEDTIFKERLEVLKKMYSTRLNVHYVFSREETKGELFGRCDAGNINYILKNHHKDVVFDQAFLCGPERMIRDLTEVLKNSIPEENIHYELFSVPVTADENNDIPEGNSEITIMLDDEETTFVMSQKKTILNAALNKDLDAPYSCQGGICSSCLGRVTEGAVTMEKNEILTDDEIEEGLILTCQAHPTTPKIKIDFDDV